MEPRRRLPRLLGLATFVLLLSVAVPVLGSGHVVRAVVPGPAATITVAATNLYGGVTGTFFVGLSQGRVAWAISDPSGDTSATVKINDQNAGRDGLTNPVATYTAQFHGGTVNDSYLWGVSFQIPFTLSAGGTWNITASATNGGTSFTTFQVVTFQLYASAYASGYLPGHTAQVGIETTRTVNGAPFAPVSLVATGTYLNTTGVAMGLFPKGGQILTPAGIATLSFTVPVGVRAPSTIVVFLYANNSGENHTWVANVNVGTLTTTLAASSTPGGASTVFFTSGSLGYATATEWITGLGGPILPAANITVKFTFMGPHGALATVPGNPPLTVTTGTSGIAQIAFVADSATFVPLATYGVWANATDSAGPAKAASVETNFSVLAPPHGGAGLVVTFTQAEYFAGDTATVDWTIGSSNSTPVTGYTVSAWFAFTTTYGTLYATGIASGTGTSGSLTIPTPQRYAGGIEVELSAHNATQTTYGLGSTTVIPPVLVLSPSENYYAPGDSVSVSLQTQGSVFGSASYWGSVDYPGGQVLWSGAISSMSFSFTVPIVGTPSYFVVSATAQGSSGTIASATIDVNQLSSYMLSLAINTASSYADGSFQPGQTIQVQYTVSATGSSPLPQYLTLEFAIGGSGLFGGPNYHVLSVSGSSGSFSATIPSSVGTGEAILLADALFTCGLGTCGSQATLIVPVNSHPAALSYEVVPGSGVTVAWLILLAVIVIGAVLLLLRRRRRRASPTPLAPYSEGATSTGSSGSGGPGSSGPS